MCIQVFADLNFWQILIFVNILLDRRKSAEGIDCVVSCVTEPLSTTEASTAETTSTASSSTATFPTTTTEG